jgi:hypothetical protein
MFYQEKIIEDKMCFEFLYNSHLKHFSFYEEVGYYHEHSQAYKQSICYSCQNLMKLESSQQIFKQFSNFMQIHLVKAESFHTDGQMLQSQQSPFRVL